MSRSEQGSFIILGSKGACQSTGGRGTLGTSSLQGQEFDSEGYFTYSSGPPHGAVSVPHFPTPCGPCRACIMNAGAQAIFLSTPAEQGPPPTHRTDHTGHSGSAALALGICAHTCDKGTNQCTKQESKADLVILAITRTGATGARGV